MKCSSARRIRYENCIDALVAKWESRIMFVTGKALCSSYPHKPAEILLLCPVTDAEI